MTAAFATGQALGSMLVSLAAPYEGAMDLVLLFAAPLLLVRAWPVLSGGGPMFSTSAA